MAKTCSVVVATVSTISTWAELVRHEVQFHLSYVVCILMGNLIVQAGYDGLQCQTIWKLPGLVTYIWVM